MYRKFLPLRSYFSSGGHTVLSGSCELEREITPNSLEVHRRVSLTPISSFALGFSYLEVIFKKFA
jgi:hypothetical protein